LAPLRRYNMPQIDFICPVCDSALEEHERGYRCPTCLRLYRRFSVDGVDVVDFSSLDSRQCECNRDGITRCSIDLESQLAQVMLHRTPARNGHRLTRTQRLVATETGTGHSILDLGCGEGRSSALYARENDVYGYDICPKRMLLNEENALDKGYRALVVGNAIGLPFREASFDVVVCMEVIEHVTETRQLAAEINRVLKPGGKLLLSTPNLVGLWNRLGMVLGKGLKASPFSLLRGGGLYPLSPWREGGIDGKRCGFDSVRYPEQPLHVRFFTFESLRDFLGQTGFDVTTELGVGLVSPMADRVLCRVLKNWTDDMVVVAVKKAPARG